MRSLSLALWLLLVVPALGQLNVTSKDAAQIVGASGLLQIGDAVFVDVDAQLNIKPVSIVRIDTEASNVSVEVTDRNRNPAEYKEVTPTVIVLSKAGKYWVDVTAVDFDKNIYGRKTVVVEVGEPGPPPPPPTPPIPPDGPFDGLAAQVQSIASSIPDESRNQIAGVMGSVADKMQRFEYRQLSQATRYIKDNWPSECSTCVSLYNFLEEHAKGRSLSWQETQAYYREVAKGVL